MEKLNNLPLAKGGNRGGRPLAKYLHINFYLFLLPPK